MHVVAPQSAPGTSGEDGQARRVGEPLGVEQRGDRAGRVAVGEPGAGGGGSEPLPVLGFGLVALAVLAVFGAVAAWRSRRLTPASG